MQRRRDHDRHVLDGKLGAALAYGFAEEGVDADRKMRPVLLHRGNGEHHDRVLCRLGAQVFRGQLFPHHRRHQ
jgi:hypothetical protein